MRPAKSLFGLRCWWKGHEYPLLCEYDDCACIFCGVHIDEHGKGSIRYRVNTAIWRTKRRFQNWYRPCPECGLRFGRHDDTKDHIPF